MTREEEIRRAQLANQFLGDDLFKDAMKKLRDHAMEQFKSAKTFEEFQRARATHDVTEEFMNVFIGIIRDGEYAAKRMDADNKLKKPELKPGDKFVPSHAQF